MERQSQTSESRHEYRGLPVTSVAVILPAVFIISYFLGNSRPPIHAAAVLLLIMSIAFISPFKLLKPHLIGKIGLIIIGLIELALLLLGKAYYVRTPDTDPSIVFENKATVEEIKTQAAEAF